MRQPKSLGLWAATAVLLIVAIILAIVSRQVESYAVGLYAGAFVALFAAAIVGYKAYSRPTK